ncbi:MAG TPA: tetratricopeptide repeat protein [Bacteroidota bacterium]|nr:tetratricopeptide repeat protein [Bacteroidota bacterium]
MIGSTVSHYRILKKLGEGGMGVVYEAEDTRLRRTVALKFLPPELTRDAEAKRRFIQEARAASSLDHPNIAVVHDIDETPDGKSFICMAYYEGETLRQRLEKGKLSVQEAINIAIQVAQGLRRASEAGIVHRDIKPANLIITTRGEIKIVDFGIAKLADQTKATRGAPTAGTAAYMAPEQILGNEADHRSDLFSLGVVLYEMVTGRRPFLGEHEPALLYSIVNTIPPPPSSIVPDISPELDRIILKLLEKDPARRYQSAIELWNDLNVAMGEQPTPLPSILPHIRISSKILLSLIISVILVLLFALPQPRDRLTDLIKAILSSRPQLLVVLPFAVIGPDSVSAAVADGLTDVLSARVTQFASFKEKAVMIPPADVRQRKIATAGEAWREFGATHAIGGSIQRNGNRLRVILTLNETDPPRQIDSRELEMEAAQLTSLQNSATEHLMALLGAEVESSVLTPALGETTDERANDFYLLARGYLSRYEKSGNIDLAIELLKQALERDSLFALAHAALGEAYLRKYDFTKDAQWVNAALESCNRSILINEDLPAAHITKGILLTTTGRYEDAILEFLLALRRDSSSADAHRELAKAYESLERYAEAEQSLQKAIEHQPRDWMGYNTLGTFYRRRGRNDLALEQYKKVVELTPDNAQGYNSLGTAYFQLGKLAEAQQMFERSIEIEPNYRAFSNLATILYHKEKYEEAARAYEKALTFQPKNYRVWGYLGEALHRSKGKREEMRQAFRRAAELAEEQRNVNPRDADLLSFLGNYYVKLGDTKKAEEHCLRAVKLAPENVNLRIRVAEAFEEMGKRDIALQHIELGLKHGYSLEEFMRIPGLEALKEDARFKRIVRSLK